ncbi:MAG: polysaccharide deacetylase family protein [Oscillospiraceae bacterium]|nr:polysaccharide deacetylase family protein [Oscillospiraceae bacterium]
MKSKKRIILTVFAAFAALILILFTIKFVVPRIPGGDAALPVLMYHHIAENSTESTIVTPARFDEQMRALSDAGYNSVTVQQVINFVGGEGELPEKPVLITFDDGYTSNLDIAAPILEKYGMCATVFVIGVNVGKEIYIHSGNPLYPPRFSYEDAAPWIEKGVIDVQSHSFDMHQLKSYGYSGRDGMLRLKDESDEAYAAAVKADCLAFAESRRDKISTELTALSYPFGYYTKELDSILSECGIQMTFTIKERINSLKIGDPSCLRMMGRFNITERLSGKMLLLWIK